MSDSSNRQPSGHTQQVIMSAPAAAVSASENIKSPSSSAKECIKRDNSSLFKSARGVPPKCRVDDLQSYFHLPIVEVAAKFNVCTTAFKKHCRRLGIQRWPHRQIRKIVDTIEELKVAFETSVALPDRDRIAAQIQLLEAKKQAVIETTSSGYSHRLRKDMLAAALMHGQVDTPSELLKVAEVSMMHRETGPPPVASSPLRGGPPRMVGSRPVALQAQHAPQLATVSGGEFNRVTFPEPKMGEGGLRRLLEQQQGQLKLEQQRLAELQMHVQRLEQDTKLQVTMGNQEETNVCQHQLPGPYLEVLVQQEQQKIERELLLRKMNRANNGSSGSPPPPPHLDTVMGGMPLSYGKVDTPTSVGDEMFWLHRRPLSPQEVSAFSISSLMN